jgi:diacylglycerol kinase (ATP)
MYVEEMKKLVGVGERQYYDGQEYHLLACTSSSSSDDDEDDENGAHNQHSGDEDYEESCFRFSRRDSLAPPSIMSPCSITFTLSPTSGESRMFPPTSLFYEGVPPSMIGSPPITPVFPPSPSIELPPGCEEAPSKQRRRSISRQEAIFVEPTGNSLENVSNASEISIIATEDCASDNDLLDNDMDNLAQTTTSDFVRDIYLAVPDLKRDRAASVDSCFSKLSAAKTEELKPPEGNLDLLTVPSSGAVRSRSVDIVLPTEEQARYKALALAGPTNVVAHLPPKG